METILTWGLHEFEYKDLQQNPDFCRVNFIKIEESYLLQRVAELLGAEKQDSDHILESDEFKKHLERVDAKEQPRICDMIEQPAAQPLVLERIKGWRYFLFDVHDLEGCLRSLRTVIKSRQCIFSRITPLAKYWYLSNYLLELQEEHVMMQAMHRKRREQVRALSKDS